MSKSKRSRGTTKRHRDADTALDSLKTPDAGVRTRSGAVVAPPETSHGRVSGRAPSPAPGGSHPSPPATVKTDEKRTWSPSSPGPAAAATAAARPPATHAAPSSRDTTELVDRRSDRGEDSRSPEKDASPASVPASPTHQTHARDAPAFDGSAKMRPVRFSRHVHGFRFTKAERGLLVSVFERFDGKTPSRDVCDAIARAFTRSPVRDPTRRALTVPDEERATAPRVAAPAPPARDLLPDPADAGVLSLASSPFRGAARRDAADAAGAATATEAREGGGPELGARFGSGAEVPPPASSPGHEHAKARPDEGLAFFVPAEAREREVWADAVADAVAEAAGEDVLAGATGEDGDGSSRGDKTKSLLSLPPADVSRTSSLPNAFVGSASRLERLDRELDVAVWQPVGTSLYVGERAESATPPRARRVSSPSPPPPPADPAPAVPYLPETPGVLASEDTGVKAFAGAEACFYPRPVADDDPAWSGCERGAGDASGARAAARDEAPESGGDAETSFRGAARGAIVDAETRAGLGVAGLAAAFAPSSAYPPGVSLEDLVREKEDDLAAALALGARTGRWIPLAVGGGGGEEPRDGGGGEEPRDGGGRTATGTDARSSAAQAAAMVSSAAEELGDGEAHPVTWKQIKTWFENRRMTQKRIKEGIARPPRRNNTERHDARPAPEPPFATVAKGEARHRGKSPRAPVSKTRATPAGGVSASKRSKSPERGFVNGRDEHGSLVAFARGADAVWDLTPPPPRRSLDETRRDATARPGAKRARTDAGGSRLVSKKPTSSLRVPARRSLDLDRASLDAAAAAAAAAEDLRLRDAAWGEPASALTREMSWADIYEALAGAERARKSTP